jgi:cytochrome c peroxidase
MKSSVKSLLAVSAAVLSSAATVQLVGAADLGPTEADKVWLLPDQPPYPADNRPNEARVELGKMLFFDPRLARDGNMSCATCHSPLLGWSDGLSTAKGAKSMVLGRATPTVVNTAYNSIQMWDGRKATLEDQAMGPMQADVEMNADIGGVFSWLNGNEGYRHAFAKAYPGEAIDAKSFSKAIASFERTVVSNDSAFDRWLKGNHDAMTPQQVRGFRLFQDENKGNCAACHQAPNFTDNGFHNIGLASYGKESPDMGRYTIRPVKSMKGAFKTPTLRDIELTAPYFHDGSAKTLMDAVEHYAKGGEVKSDLSPNIKQLNLTREEKEDIVAFMKALTSPQKQVTLPHLPQ